MTPYYKAYKVVGYTYMDARHCVACSIRCFGTSPTNNLDYDGNPVFPILLEYLHPNDVCVDCLKRLDD